MIQSVLVMAHELRKPVHTLVSVDCGLVWCRAAKVSLKLFSIKVQLFAKSRTEQNFMGQRREGENFLASRTHNDGREQRERERGHRCWRE